MKTRDICSNLWEITYILENEREVFTNCTKKCRFSLDF